MLVSVHFIGAMVSWEVAGLYERCPLTEVPLCMTEYRNFAGLIKLEQTSITF